MQHKMQHKCLTFPIPILKQMEKSNGNIVYGSLHYFDPINKYQNFSFTDVKDLSIENENFIDIYLINKTNYKVVIKNELIGFIYQNITFKTFDKEIFQTNSLDLFSALYHLIYENENDIEEIFNIEQNETIEQIATLERKPNLNIAKYNRKTEVKLNIPLKKDAIFKKQRISKVPVPKHLRERIQN